jgi:hypothetical protein
MSNSKSLLSGYMPEKELAAEFDLTPRTLDRWNVLGIGPPRTYIGRKGYYNRESVLRWLAAQETAPQGYRRIISPHRSQSAARVAGLSRQFVSHRSRDRETQPPLHESHDTPEDTVQPGAHRRTVQ